MELTYKQTEALDILEDNKTEELLFGGAAGGAKTSLGCYWQLKRRFKYPGSRGFIGRARFTTLIDTTVKTFFEIAQMQGIKRGKDFELTGPWDKEYKNCIVFRNGSLIFLRDLFHYPQDPDFDDLGSLEITDAFVDECGQVVQKAKDTLKVRIRFGLEKWGLIPKMMFGTNPVKSWPYLEFYRPFKENALPEHRRFLQSFVYDNPHVGSAYIKSLETMPEGPQKQRLLYGNWEYDDDPSALIEYDKILNCFTNTWIAGKEKYITCDVARFGTDNTIIGVWNGWSVKLYKFHGLSVSQTADEVRKFQLRTQTTNSKTLVDEDGVGGGVVDILGCQGFVNNSKPLEIAGEEKENFINLKSQCYFHLAERINKDGIYINCNDPEIKSLIIQELEQVKQYNMDKDGKRAILPKDKVKELIGRSPDFADTIMMREWFELTPAPTWVAF